jgi:hypothetical protein
MISCALKNIPALVVVHFVVVIIIILLLLLLCNFVVVAVDLAGVVAICPPDLSNIVRSIILVDLDSR